MSGDTFASPETTAAVLTWLKRQSVGGFVSTSYREAGRSLGLGRQTAARAIARLLADGALTVDRLGTGCHYPTRYRLSDSRSPVSILPPAKNWGDSLGTESP